jgi:hypothetical protein
MIVTEVVRHNVSELDDPVLSSDLADDLLQDSQILTELLQTSRFQKRERELRRVLDQVLVVSPEKGEKETIAQITTQNNKSQWQRVVLPEVDHLARRHQRFVRLISRWGPCEAKPLCTPHLWLE